MMKIFKEICRPVQFGMLKIKRLFSKRDLLPICISLSWYLILFPGRLGFDSAQAIRLIQKGETSDWWSSAFFWFVRISTLNGSTIAIASFVQLSFLYFSVHRYVYSLPVNQRITRQALIFFLATPFFGFFGAGISHDVFLVSGILLILSNENDKNFRIKKVQTGIFEFVFNGALIFSLSMTKIGLFLLLIYGIILIYRKNYLSSIFIVAGSVLFYFVSSLGIASQSSQYYLWPAIADLKCIAQHPEAEITMTQWDWLETIAPKSQWTTPISCSSMDQAVELLGAGSNFKSPSTLDFIKNYFSIAKQNPAIVLMSHINKSRVALPPPFFPIPENQVSLNPNIPIGLGTNIALQSGPEVLHPSIDESSMKQGPSPLYLLERITQIPTFIINQASWFWGWGGLWLWPIAYFGIKKTLTGSRAHVLIANWPTLALHLFLFFLSPGSLPRYVMSTLYCGFILTIILFLEKMNGSKNYD